MTGLGRPFHSRNMGTRAGMFGQVLDFDLAMGRQRTNRDQTSLQASVECFNELHRVVDLENHPVERLQTQLQKGPGHTVGAVVEL